MYFLVFPVFPSVSAMLKSTLQIQKASAEQQLTSAIILQDKGEKTQLLGRQGVDYDDLFRLEADSLILMWCTPKVFS